MPGSMTTDSPNARHQLHAVAHREAIRGIRCFGHTSIRPGTLQPGKECQIFYYGLCSVQHKIAMGTKCDDLGSMEIFMD